MLSACNFAIISKSQKTELEGSSQGHAAWPGAKSSPNPPHKAEVPCAAAFGPRSSGKSTAWPKNPCQSIPTFNLNVFCYRLSLWFLSSFLSGHKTSLFISSLFKYLSYNIMSSPSVLPAQDSMSSVLATFLQKSHLLDLSSFFAELSPDPPWRLDHKSWTVHCTRGFASPEQSRRDTHLQVTDRHVYLHTWESFLHFIHVVRHIGLSVWYFWDSQPSLWPTSALFCSRLPVPCLLSPPVLGKCQDLPFPTLNCILFTSNGTSLCPDHRACNFVHERAYNTFCLLIT